MSLQDQPALVLVAEGGAGKSTEMELLRQHLEAQSRPVALVRCRDVGIEPSSIHDLVQATVASRISKLDAAECLTLLVDGLDEWRLGGPEFALRFRSAMMGIVPERVCVRFTLRPSNFSDAVRLALLAPWSGTLHEKNSEDIGRVWTLAPLRVDDVRAFAAADGKDPDTFVDVIRKRRLVDLAKTPVTLKMLTEEFSPSGELPQTRAELYRRTIERKCQEFDQARVVVPTPEHGWPDRFAAVAAIATALKFSGKAIVSFADALPEDSGVLWVEDLCGTTVRLSDRELMLKRHLLWETQRIGGVFATAGRQSQMMFVERTYVDFLTAWLINECCGEIEEKATLLVRELEGQRYFPTSVADIAGRLCELSPRFWDFCCSIDPLVVLRGDLSAGTDLQRREFALGALKKARTYDEDAWEAVGSHPFYGLEYPGLADDLEKVLTSRSSRSTQRELAIEMLQGNMIGGLQCELLATALRHGEWERVRKTAAHALADAAKEGSTESAAALIVLLHIPDTEDDADELRGIALDGLFPEWMDLDEVIESLTPIKRSALLGHYRRFVWYLSERLTASECLRLCTRWMELNRSIDAFELMIARALIKGWESVSSEHDAAEWVRVLHFLSSDHHHQLPSDERRDLEELLERIVKDDRQRRLFWQGVARFTNTDQSIAHVRRWLVLSSHDDRDLSWMIGELDSANGEARRAWAELIRFIFLGRDAGSASLILEAAATHSEIAQAFSDHIGSVHLDSPEAANARGELAARRKLDEQLCAMERRNEDHTMTTVNNVIARIVEFIDQCETGTTEAWWKASYFLGIDDRDRLAHFYDADMRNGPAWSWLTMDQQNAIVDKAVSFVQSFAPRELDLTKHDQVHLPSVAVCRALILLANVRPNTFAQLSDASWAACAPSVLSGHRWMVFSEGSTDLVRLCWERASAASVSAGRAVVASRARAGAHLWIEELVGSQPTAEGLDLLADLANDTTLGEEACLTCVTLLARLSPSRGVAIVRALRARSLSLVHVRLSALLALYGTDAERDSVLREISAKPADIRSFALFLERHPHTVACLEQSSPLQLRILHELIERDVPYASHTYYGGVGYLGDADTAARLRDAALRELGARGTLEALRELRALQLSRPDLTFLEWHVGAAKRLTQDAKWANVSWSNVRKLLATTSTRLVQNEQDLLRVVREAMLRFEKELQGVTPAVFTVWNEVRRSVWRPKQERDLCDAISRFLKHDLGNRPVVANREVEISPPAGAGARTDILVHAISPGTAGSKLTVVVEVKANWNHELLTGLKSQLVERYLTQKHLRCGLYVVGVFDAAQWDSLDTRRARARRFNNPRTLRSQLQRSAHHSSVGDISVSASTLDCRLPKRTRWANESHARQ